jgi:nucleoside-diphosphate-sugar epimerase
MKVLITGHDGYIGSVMVPALQAAGHEVVGVDTFYFSNHQESINKGFFELHRDIRDFIPGCSMVGRSHSSGCLE